MARLVRDAGRYYLVGDHGCDDITEDIENEIRSRVAIELRLAEYNRSMDTKLHFRLAATKMQLATSKKHLSELLKRAQASFDSWAKTGNPHGAMIALRPYLSIVKKWLDDSKEND